MGSFTGFDIQNPENIIACRNIVLQDCKLHITPAFERQLNNYRGSLALPNCGYVSDLLVALKNSRAHLDIIYVEILQEQVEISCNGLIDGMSQFAFVSCNTLIWKTGDMCGLARVYDLLQTGSSNLVLHLDLTVSANYQDDRTREEYECVKIFDVTQNERVKELHWDYSPSFIYDEDYEGVFEYIIANKLPNLGKLTALGIGACTPLSKDAPTNLLSTLMSSQADDLKVKLCDRNQECNFDYKRLAPYVRSNPNLSCFDLSNFCYEDYQEVLNIDHGCKELAELAKDHASLRRDSSPSPTHPSRYCCKVGAYRRPSLFFLALRQRVSEIQDYW